MGNLFDLCSSRKSLDEETIVLFNQADKDFCKKFQNGCVTNVTFPSGFKVPPKKYGLDWIIKENRLVLEKRKSDDNLQNEFLILIAPNDVGYAHHYQGKICSGKILPSGLQVPPSRNGREWFFDSGAVVLK